MKHVLILLSLEKYVEDWLDMYFRTSLKYEIFIHKWQSKLVFREMSALFSTCTVTKSFLVIRVALKV